MGGTIAASTPQNIIWAPAQGNQPYYTLNGGTTWSPITLPGVTSWSGFDWAYYLDQRSVTADRVLANTFYLYDPGQGVFETTNGGSSWTKVYSGYIESNSSMAGYNSSIQSVPGEASNLFYTSGPQGTPSATPVNSPFYRSTNGGATWTAVPNVLDVFCFGFGAAAPGQSYPAIYIVGYVNNVYGIWQSTNNAQSWTNIGTYPLGELDQITTISGDPNTYGEVYVGFSGGGYAYLPAASSTSPTITGISDSPATGALDAGKTVALTLSFSEAVTVAGGTPTLTLNDGGTATYASGSGTSALIFNTTVAAGQSAASLAATALNLATGVTIKDSAGNAASLTLSGLTQSGPQIDTATPAVTGVTASPATGALDAGKTVALTLSFSEAVTVAGGTPTLTLNDGGTATYASGSGTNALTFGYTVGAGQNTPDLAVTAINLNSATVTDGAGNPANTGGALTTLIGLQIDTAAPTVASVVESPPTGSLTTGQAGTITLNLSEPVTLTSVATASLGLDGNAALASNPSTAIGSVTLTTTRANDVIILEIAQNGTTVTSVSDTAGLTWHQRAVLDPASNPSYEYYAIAPNVLSGDTIDVNYAKTPFLEYENAFGISGANTTSPFDPNLSSPVTTTSSPASLTTTNANDFVFASYVDGASPAFPSPGSGWTAIDTAFSFQSEYQVVSSPQTGLVATTAETGSETGFVDAVVAASASSTPTLTLNDGGTATYASGSGTNALTFNYTVGSGQTSPSLAATSVNLNGASVTDAAGNGASLSLTGQTQNGPAINAKISSPTITAVTESPATGALDAGKTVALTLTFSEAVTVAGGAPTLTLNDGGTATYASGSGANALTFNYTVAAGQNAASLAATALNLPTGVTIADAAGNAASLSLSALTQSGPQIDTTTPAVTAISDSPATGALGAGKTVALTLSFSEAVTVAGGTPTLTLNDGGTATYVSGSGTNALTFNYTVAAGQNAASLAATALNLPTGVTIADSAGNAASLSLSGLSQTGPQIDTTTPAVTAIADSPATGALGAGKTVALTLSFSEAVTVAGGTPTLTLNDGGTATYASGSGTNALTFNYTVAAGQNAASLAATALNLPTGVTIADSAGNAASLSLSGLSQTGPQIDTTTPAVTAIADSPATGALGAGKTVALTLSFSEAVTVAGGTPTLTLNDGGTATYASGSGANALTFNYTVAAGQNAASLAATALNLPTGVTIADSAGNAASLSLSGLSQSGPQIDTVTPAVAAIADSPATGDLNAGKTVALTLSFSEAVTVAGGTPTLTLNDGGTATYASGSGANALTFNYTVAAGQNAASLAATALNLPTGVTIADSAGNAASLSLSGLSQSGPQIDTVTPAVTAIANSPATGDLNAGKTVALTLSFSEAVTVAGGTPTLTLNDGGTATYASGSGTNALTFNYTVAAGQNTPDLMVAAVNLNSASVDDSAGNAANLSLSSVAQSSPQIDTTTPAVTAIADSPATGALDAGKTVALTLSFSEAVTVAGGTPTLTLNDGGTATYASGSGTNALVFNTTVAAGQTAASLAATALNLPTGVTIADAAGNAASLTLSGLSQSGPQIDTTTPAVTAIADSPATGALDAGKTVALTLSFSEAVTVAGGTPTLTLNDGGTATYASGSGANALTFNYTVAAGQNAASLAATALNLPTGVTIADAAGNAASLMLSGLSQSGPQIDTVTPAVAAIADSPSTGALGAGKTVALTLSFSEAVTVAGGTPTLTLNDGGTATYASGSGANALTFNYTVAAGQNAASLAATALNLPTGVTIADAAGNAASLSLSALTQSGPQIDTVTPAVAAIADSPSTGALGAGKTVALTLSFSEAVTVAGGTPTLTLNDGGTATYASGSGANALTFNYTVAAGQNAASLAATALNLPTGVTITDGAGNAASLSLSALTQSGPQIDTTTPAVTAISDSPATGALGAGKTVALTLSFSEAVTVAGGTPTLTLNDGGTATYVSGSGTNALTFNYTVAAGQNAASLAATALNLPTGVTIADSAGNAASLSLSGLSQTGPQIDTTTPAVTAISDSPATGDLNAGKTVALTLAFSEAVTVAGGTPTLSLNDGGTATYASGSGTNALTFNYTVAAGQNTPDLMVAAVNLNSASVDDSAGNAANLSLSSVAQSSPQIDTTTPAVTAIADSPATGALDAGKTVALTLSFSEAVTVAGGTPTLTLNDGGTATYASGSGTNALVFNTTVAAGQTAASLAATALNLPTGVTIADAAGNAASLTLSGLSQSGPQIDTTTPAVTAIADSPATGALDAGKTVALTLSFSEAVTVAGGTPTLTLNDGGTATYASGSGTNALTFNYTVAAGQNAASLAATALNLPTGVTIADSAGNAASLSLSALTQSGPQIDTVTPAVAAIADSPSTGALGAGKTVALTLSFSEAVTVAGGTPTLTLNDGGTATYASGSGANALTFNYTVAAGQNAASLAATALNLPTGVTIADAAGNAASLSLSALTQSGPQIDTTTPAVTAISDSPATGALGAGKTVALTLSFSEAVTVAGGTPTLTLNDGGTATYVSGSGANALTFNSTVAAGQNAASLAATALNLPTGVTIADSAGNAASLSLSGLSQTGPQIDTTTPAVTAISDSPATGDLNAGKTVALTLAFSEAVTVAGGTPTLSLNDGGTATYASGSGTNALVFNTTVAAGQSAASLAVTALNLPTGVTIADAAGNAASLSLSGLIQSGPQIDTTTPAVTAIADSPSTGDLNAGKTVALTLTFSEAVTVAGGTPTLTLNDGGTATYASGSGTNALTFNYTVAAGQNTPDLMVATVNLNSASVDDSAGNAANLSLSSVVQSSPQVDTTPPDVTGVTASPATGAETIGNAITFTVNMSEAVTVAGGTPTLTLNDGGTAAYASGSGTNVLTFNYTVKSTDTSVSNLAVTAVNVPSGVTITDGAGNAANMAAALTTFTGLSVNAPVTVAGYLANQAALDATGNIAIADTAADVSASFNTLNGDAHVTAIALTDTGTPTLSLTVAQALNDAHALGVITNSSYAVAVADTAADVAANLNGLNADGHVTSVTLTDAGQPTLTLTITQVLSDTTALAEISSPYFIAIADTAANIQALTSAQITTLHAAGVSQIAATNGSVGLSAAQAVALENQFISVSAPTGALVTVSDTAANLQGMTTAQVYGLGMIGVDGLTSTNANVTFNAAQTSAILAAKLSVSASGGYSVTEKFTSGATIASSETGSGAGALTLSTKANGLTVDFGGSALSVIAGAETIPLQANSTESITATSRTSDAFVFAAGFGSDTITGFAATGANHDTLQFSASTFSYLTSGMSQAQDLAAVLSHATSSGGTTTISDSMGDKLVLSATSVATLTANPADFKFV